MYGLIGFPLGHSFSQEYFTEKFRRENIDESYKLFPLSSLSEFSTVISDDNLKGLNVTIPYKEEIIKYIDTLSIEAKEIGAINVIKKLYSNNEIKLLGDNTDWKGFRDSLISMGEFEGKKALILGSGGASKAVGYALKKLNIPYKIVSRNNSTGDYVYSDITSEILSEYHIIINTTPLGTYPNNNTFPPLPYHHLSSKHLCHDLVYNPSETEFMKRSKKFGARVKNGLEMLYRQADYAWEIWKNS